MYTYIYRMQILFVWVYNESDWPSLKETNKSDWLNDQTFPGQRMTIVII